MTETPTARMAPIQIGMNARLYPGFWRPAREEVAFARALGFAWLQFPGPEHGLDADRLGDPPRVVAAALQGAGIGAVMEIGVQIDAAGRTAAGRTPLDALRANLPAIAALRCARVHWHLAPAVGFDADAADAPREMEESLRPQFAAAVALAARHGFRFGVEHNEPRLGLYATPARCAAILDAVPGLGFVWDINHATPEQVGGYLALTPRMTLLHISDTPLPAVNAHLPLGLGTVDLAAYCRELLARGFRGPAILEIGGLPQSGGYGRDTDAALADSRERLRRAVDTASVSDGF